MFKKSYRNQVCVLLIKKVSEKSLFLFGAATMSALLVGCSQSPANDLSHRLPSAAMNDDTTSIWPKIESDIKKDPAIESRVQALLVNM